MTRRSLTPEATWERLEPLLPLLGITRVANLTGLDVLGLPVFTAFRPRSRALGVSQGKGPTAMDARVGAVMESVETWSAERMVRDLKVAAYDDLRHRGVPCVDPNTLARLPGKLALLPDEPTIWCEAQWVGTGEPVWVPFAPVHTMYTSGGHLGMPRWTETSRGLAAGMTRAECLSHGLCELLEGHANAGMLTLDDAAFGERRIDLDTVDDPLCRSALAQCATAGMDVLAIDTTTEIGIASFQAVILDHDDQPWRVIASARGMGCHPDRGRALYRALSEAAQSRATLISGVRDDLPLATYRRSQDPAHRAAMREAAKGAARPFQAVPTRDAPDALGDAAICTVALQRAGYEEILAVDCTRDPRLPVLRVIVPGLRPEPRP